MSFEMEKELRKARLADLKKKEARTILLINVRVSSARSRLALFGLSKISGVDLDGAARDLRDAADKKTELLRLREQIEQIREELS